jgi:hypothetical protein
MKRQFLFQTCIALFLLASPWLAGPALADWNIQTVDSTGNLGQNTSIALDADGKPHISYSDRTNWDVKYAAFNGSTWDISIVDSTGCYDTSIALDANGYAHISYGDSDNTALKYAAFNGSTWDIETVDSNRAIWTSIALDANGYPHISYGDSNNDDLKYAAFNGSTWDIETVDDTRTGLYTSIALDANGKPHISYHHFYGADSGALKYAAFNGSTWDIETIDGITKNNGRYGTSIAVDADGKPHISYFAAFFGYHDLKYAAFNGSTWDIETVDSNGMVGWMNSIALDADGYPHISYYGSQSQGLKYAAFNGSTWDIEIVDSTGGQVGQYTSIALDAKGYAHISYQEHENGDVKYAYYSYCGYVLVGDMDDDCKVDFLDVRTFVNTCWLTAGPEGDIYVDGWVDFRDYAAMAMNWLIDCDQTPGNPACVPK